MTRPYTERGLLIDWEQENRKFKLVKKTCSELEVGDIFKTTVDPCFCEVVDILPDEILPGYRLFRLNLLPDQLIGESFLCLNRVFQVKSSCQ